MQRFTLFSMILSAVVVLTIGDVLFHGYLSGSTEDPLPVDNGAETALPSDIEPSDTQGNDAPDTVVQLQEEILPLISVDMFSMAGLMSPTIKEMEFSGFIFQFVPFTDSGNAKVYQWNIFDGENYVGSAYEIKYGTDTAGFQGYLGLRDTAKGLVDLGTTNETNNYGDASFYFNHKVKTGTVHLVMRSGKDVFAFEYAQSFHENMKKVFDIL
ncbi:MAG: hypothetical protein WC846_01255 [Candidatus Gracilibacteria bacterium]|jgi:hypothetical protein